ncbi:hypothetical protein M9H77_16817 [Catharanthus roseus]|uniref:Uncharacterized protein n=1 Tax=Catharanthus roseus TaxID=4058 RepID=A0ACC0B2U2_CATRO|nr:hypothetical protein M9H77_16817 [Catharanthus roseus]
MFLRRFGICGEESSRKNVSGTRPYLCQRSGMLGRTGQQAKFVDQFSKSKELEELYKHQSGEEGENERFHEAKKKVEEEAAVTGTVVPDNLAFMAIVVGGVRRGHVYGAGLEVVHLRAESSQTLSCRGLALICPDMLRTVEAAVYRADLVYIPPPLILDLVRAAMGTDTSTSSPPAPDVDSEVPTLDGVVRSSSTPLPLFVLLALIMPSCLLVILEQIRMTVGNRNTDDTQSVGNICLYSLPTDITTSTKLFNYADVSQEFQRYSVRK